MKTFKQAQREREWRQWHERRQEKLAVIATRPMHEIHPGMLVYLHQAQIQRPSYGAWLHDFLYREGPR